MLVLVCRSGFFPLQSTYQSIGLVALTYNLPIVVGYSRRVENRFFFEIGVQRIIFPHEWADKEDPLKWVTSEYTKAIEAFVREDPTQYWWLHRRWKTRPKEERLEQAEAAVAPGSDQCDVRVVAMETHTAARSASGAAY